MYSPRCAYWAIGQDHKLATETIREQVEALVRVNMHLRRAMPSMPTLAQANLPYKDSAVLVCDSSGGGCHYTEGDWQDWMVSLERGHGDCKVLVAEEIAELRLAGISAIPLIRCYKCPPTNCPTCWLPFRRGAQTWHVQTLRYDGRVSDPSREAGMPPHSDGDDAVLAPSVQVGIVRRIGW